MNLYQADFVLALGSVIVLIALLATYLPVYRRLREPYTLGLTIFATILLLEELTSGARLFYRGFIAPSPNTPEFPLGLSFDSDLVYLGLVPDALELCALCILLWLARR